MRMQDWDPKPALAMLRERMNRLFDASIERRETSVEEIFSPPADVYATSEKIVISIELPGLNAGDIQLSREADDLVVRGCRAFRREGSAYHRLERNYGDFRCQVALPPGADLDRRSMQLEEGVLTIEVPRAAKGGGTKPNARKRPAGKGTK